MRRDEHALHVKQASEAHYLGPANTSPYLKGELLIEIARSSGADAIHPGWFGLHVASEAG